MPEPYITEKTPPKGLVVHPVVARTEKALSRTPEEALEEAMGLCLALDLSVTGTAVHLREVTPKTFLGRGKVEALKEEITAHNIDVLIVNTRLQPTQQRNLELALKCKVIDRTGLILEIFADRAQTHAGRLQVTLAQLQYQSGRLVRAWTHLERQRGGLGKTGGPGERQIELDRRMIRQKIDKTKKELAEVAKTRTLHRKNRGRSGQPVIALVGYTNAGKSTLFNSLTKGEKGAKGRKGEAFTKNMLFATLDPLMRKAKLTSGREVVFSDTVGFISDLPHELIKAFHATLEEVLNADLLLHVQDASSPMREIEEADVKNVLSEIGAEHIPQITVYNKQDLLPEGEESPLFTEGVLTSAQTGLGIKELQNQIEQFFIDKEAEYIYKIPADQGQKIAWLKAYGDVLSTELEEDVYVLKVRLSKENAAIFEVKDI